MGYRNAVSLEQEHLRSIRSKRPTTYIGQRVDWIDAAGRNVTGTVAMSTGPSGRHCVVWDDGSCTWIPEDATVRFADEDDRLEFLSDY